MKRKGKKFKNNVIPPERFKGVKSHIKSGASKEDALRINQWLHRQAKNLPERFKGDCTI